MSSFLYPQLLQSESSYSYLVRAAMLNGTGYSDALFRHTKELERKIHLAGSSMTVSQAFSVFDAKLPDHPLMVYESFGKSHSWKFCPQCRKSDLESFGTSYWRWTHQLPGSFICSEHYCLLYEVLVPEGFKHQSQFLLPQNLAVKADNLYSYIDFDAGKSWCSISMVAALRRRTPCWLPIIQATLLNTYRQLGFNVKSYKSLLDEWGHYLHGIGGEKLFNLKLLQALFTPNKAIGPIHRQFAPALLVMIIHRLYGDFDAFYEAYRWQAVMCNEGSLLRSDKLKFPGRDFHRKCCVDFLTENPGASRTDFWRSREVTCHWLMRNDTLWLDKVLPAEAKKIAFLQMQLFRS